MAYRRWKPSRSAKSEFATKMKEIEDFCVEHSISMSHSGDSYYFTVNDVNYRVSNHTVEASNCGAYDSVTGEKTRQLYHTEGRREDTVYIHAGKTRIIQIYNDIIAGYELDGRGNRKEVTV